MSSVTLLDKVSFQYGGQCFLVFMAISGLLRVKSGLWSEDPPFPFLDYKSHFSENKMGLKVTFKVNVPKKIPKKDSGLDGPPGLVQTFSLENIMSSSLF